MQGLVGICSYCAENFTTQDTQKTKYFKKNVSDIVCNVKENRLEYLE